MRRSLAVARRALRATSRHALPSTRAIQGVRTLSTQMPPSPPGGLQHPPGSMPQTPDPANDACIVEVNEKNFQEMVVQASIDDGPVLIDFYADWCNPCKALTPKLEKAVLEAGGSVRLAKCDIDGNPNLAQAFQVTSVPHVVVVYQGKMLHQFTGMKSDEEIDELITQYEAAAGKSNPKRQLSVAQRSLDKGEITEAEAMYTAVCNTTTGEAATMAKGGLAMCAAARGDLDLTKQILATLDRKSDDPGVKSTIMKVDLLVEVQDLPSTDELRAKVEGEQEFEAVRGLALRFFSEGLHTEAIDTAMKLVKRPKWKEDGKAVVLRLISALGPESPAAADGRKKLGRALFN